MIRPGHLVMTVRLGMRFGHVPAHLDCLAGAGRRVSRLDGGVIDRILNRYGGGYRCAAVFHARRSLARLGEQHVGFDGREEELGLSRTYRVEIGEPGAGRDVVAALRDLPEVESAQVQTLALVSLDRPGPAALDPESIVEAFARIRVPEAQALEPGDERVTTAVVDTGIVVGHPEFQARCLAGYDTVDMGLGRVGDGVRLLGDSRGHDYNPYDEVGHGCLVASIIGARGWRVPRGVAGNALLLPIRVLAAATSDASAKRIGVGCLPDIDEGLKVAVDLGAVVINMSFGTPQASGDDDAPKPHQRIVDYATSRGCILVAAMGNSGKPERFYPAALPQVIAVAAVDADDRRARFSTIGAHAAVAAPGVGIQGAGRRGYQSNSGTSFAAPFVTGVASLMASRARRAGRSLDGRTAKRLLVESAVPLGGGFNAETGHGLVDAYAAIRCVDAWLGDAR